MKQKTATVMIMAASALLMSTAAQSAPARLNSRRVAQATPAAPPIIAPALPAQTLTLDQVVALAVNNNSSSQLALERLKKAQELIQQVNAETRPQVSAALTDTLSSNRTFGTSASNIQSPTLPGGGTIPVITDAGGGNTATFTGGGGGGNAASSGSASPTQSTTVTTPSSSIGTTGAGTTGTGTTGGTTGTGNTGTGGAGAGGVGAGNTGTTGTGTSTTGTPGALARSMGLSALPPILQQFAALRGTTASAKPPSVRSSAVRPADTTTGTGTIAGGTGFSSGNSGHYNNYGGRITVTQYLDFFHVAATARSVEDITRDFYQTDLERVANEITLTAKNDFFNVLRAQAQVSVQQQQVTADAESLRIAQARFTAGAAPQYDVLTAQTTLSNAQQLLSQDQNTLNLDKADLSNLIEVDPRSNYALIEPPVPPLNVAYNAQQLTQAALTQRPELKQANNNIIIARKLITLAQAGLAPSLGLVGSGNYNGYVSSGSDHGTLSLSAVLGIPLDDGGTTRSKVRSAQSDLRTQQITQSQLQQNVILEVIQALSNVNDAQTRSQSASTGATSATEALRIANLRYQNGLGTILDVVNAQAQAATARTNQLNANYDYQTSLAQLTRAIGGR